MRKRRKRYYEPDYTRQQYINLFKALGSIWLGLLITGGLLYLAFLSGS